MANHIIRQDEDKAKHLLYAIRFVHKRLKFEGFEVLVS